MTKTKQTVSEARQMNIIETLDSATGLSWSTPPAQPSFLRNGYHAELPLIKAPCLVRRLQQVAIDATGKPRAIVFESCGRGKAIINIPKEVAESTQFGHALQRFEASAHIPDAVIVASQRERHAGIRQFS